MVFGGSNVVARKWLSFVAMVGVLVHAYALARHNASMLARSAAPIAIAAQSVTVARTAWTAAGLPVDAFQLCLAAEPSAPGSGGGTTSDCPLCNGTPVAAVPPPLVTVAAVPPQSTAVALPRDERSDRHIVIRPPARGPPARA